jgi:hypothetical protein
VLLFQGRNVNHCFICFLAFRTGRDSDSLYGLEFVSCALLYVDKYVLLYGIFTNNITYERMTERRRESRHSNHEVFVRECINRPHFTTCFLCYVGIEYMLFCNLKFFGGE